MNRREKSGPRFCLTSNETSGLDVQFVQINFMDMPVTWAML